MTAVLKRCAWCGAVMLDHSHTQRRGWCCTARRVAGQRLAQLRRTSLEAAFDHDWRVWVRERREARRLARLGLAQEVAS
jgi:hypothetical protein